MKNRLGALIGFGLGVSGFLLMFDLIFLDRIAPSDELAPGVVVVSAVLNGFLFAYLGTLIQNYIVKKGPYKL